MTLEQTKSEEKNPKIQLHVLKGYGETKKQQQKNSVANRTHRKLINEKIILQNNFPSLTLHETPFHTSLSLDWENGMVWISVNKFFCTPNKMLLFFTAENETIKSNVTFYTIENV